MPFGPHTLDFTPPFARVAYFAALADATGTDLRQADAAALQAVLRRHGLAVRADAARGELLETLFGNLVEPQLVQPTFVLDHPQETSPLAKAHRNDPGTVERFEGMDNAITLPIAEA